MSDQEEAYQWPDRLECENRNCGRIIKPNAGNTFSIISIQGNVIKSSGSGARDCVNSQFVVCADCTKKFNRQFVRKNKGLGLVGGEE